MGTKEIAEIMGLTIEELESKIAEAERFYSSSPDGQHDDFVARFLGAFSHDEVLGQIRAYYPGATGYHVAGGAVWVETWGWADRDQTREMVSTSKLGGTSAKEALARSILQGAVGC